MSPARIGYPLISALVSRVPHDAVCLRRLCALGCLILVAGTAESYFEGAVGVRIVGGLSGRIWFVELVQVVFIAFAFLPCSMMLLKVVRLSQIAR